MQNKNPSTGGVWIFSGTQHTIKLEIRENISFTTLYISQHFQSPFMNFFHSIFLWQTNTCIQYIWISLMCIS